jgi:hypothetical protein
MQVQKCDNACVAAWTWLMASVIGVMVVIRWWLERVRVRMSRTKDRHKRAGPFSRDESLLSLDRRTRAGRVMKSVIRELTLHIGDATAPQRLLIQSAALKSVRLALLSDQLLDGTPPSEGSDHHALSWLNSLRLDLVAIGLERKTMPSLDLNAYLKEQAAAPVAEAVAAE